MSWSEIVGHANQRERLRRGFARDRLGSAYLFVGPRGIGKYTFARKLAQTLLCERVSPEIFDACGKCQGCRLATASSHPDLLIVTKRPDKSVITIGQIRGSEEEGNGLCHDIYLKPMLATRKVAIVDDADVFQPESANALLKTLEEPPPRAVIILIGTSRQRQLPTILSRCQVIPFDPLTSAEVMEVLRRLPTGVRGGDLTQLAAASKGSLAHARMLSDPAVFAFRKEWLSRLATLDPWSDDGVKQVIDFSKGDPGEGGGEDHEGNSSGEVEREKKESVSRRDRLLWVADVTLSFYCGLARRLAGAAGDQGDTMLQETIESAASRWQSTWSALIDAIERTEEFQSQVPTNVGAANAVEDWLIDLSRLGRGDMDLCENAG